MQPVKTCARLLAVLLAASAPLALAQERVITPNENLVVENIPAIPATLAEEVGPYTEIRSASLQSWHPTRREMLILTRFADTAQVHRVKVPGGAREQITFFPERVQGAAYQPTTGDYFGFSKDVGGNEFSQLYRFDLGTAKVTLLTDGKSRNEPGPWSNRGDRVAYTSTRRNGADSDIYVVDPTNPSSTRMVAEVKGGGWGPAEWSPDDRKLLVGEYVSVNESYLWLFDVATGERTPLTPKTGNEQVAWGGAIFAKNGRGLYVTTDKGGEFQRLAYMDLATKQLKFLTDHIKWDVESMDLSDDGTMLAFVTNEDGIGVLHLLDTRTNKERPVTGLPRGVIGGLEWRKNGKELGLTISSARAATDVYSVSVDKGTVTRWTESETGGLDTSTFSEPELVRWKSFDGMSISGFVYRPSAARFSGKRPVIVNIHGGPESQFRPSFLGRNNYFINELGIAMIYPNVRGSSGYGKTFLTLDNGFKREDSVKDIGALLDWIAQQPDLDASRVMVTGGSYGGYMTLAVATHYDARIRAALDVVGISNFVTFLEKTESYRRDLRRVEYGDERDPKMREFMLTISPLNNAKKITKPLFIVQGKNDPRVPLNEAEQMLATLKAQNTPVWYLMAKDEGHGFAKKRNADYQFYATIMFARQYLLK
jgi:dipeptidyl aminopeptidase/acylaminoacyl peptidase